jgi:hypothetical protein
VKKIQVANNEIYCEYGMVLFWSHFMIHFSQFGLIFNMETSKSFKSLILVSVVFWGLISVIKTALFGLVSVSFGSRTRRDQNKTKQDPNKTVETAIKPKEGSFKTKRRPNCD